eukprot:CAMPEP_0197422390 /NCGR_PEP_ID=MMETSP1170-20131217/15481_1 /TAXON_ID=54406 /ORGANISM="Sarcinochrysis sp, Strain CCMP770" /LENGTH=236 /DNA_ID=CAMNT_0042949723 /DNA_START=55 /DNA_END=765 /DNA_ORIENTATION=+
MRLTLIVSFLMSTAVDARAGGCYMPRPLTPNLRAEVRPDLGVSRGGEAVEAVKPAAQPAPKPEAKAEAKVEAKPSSEEQIGRLRNEAADLRKELDALKKVNDDQAKEVAKLRKEQAELKAQLARMHNASLVETRKMAHEIFEDYAAKVKKEVTDLVLRRDERRTSSFTCVQGQGTNRVTFVDSNTGDEVEATIDDKGNVVVDSLQLNLDLGRATDASVNNTDVFRERPVPLNESAA